MDLHIIAFILVTIIGSFSPIFFKSYKDYFIANMTISSFCMFIFSIIIIIIKSYNDSNYILKDKISEIYKLENIVLSLLSQARFMLMQYSITLLPLLITIPLSKLTLLSIVFFDKLINKDVISNYVYLSILGILIGNFIMGYDDMFKPSKSQINCKYMYIFALINLLLGIALMGYLVNTFAYIVKKEQDSAMIMAIESGSATIVMLILFSILSYFKKINIPNLKTTFQMILGCLFIFDIVILLQYYAYESLDITLSMILKQIGVLIACAIAIFYYKEKLTKTKMLGLMVIIISSIIGGIYSK